MSVRFNEVIKQHVKVNYKVYGTDVEVRAFVRVCGGKGSLCLYVGVCLLVWLGESLCMCVCVGACETDRQRQAGKSKETETEKNGHKHSEREG